MPTKRRAAVDYDSDALDDDEPAQRKTSPQKSAKKPPKKKKRTKKEQDSDVDFDTDDDGIEVIGKLVEAPKTGQVPPGQISQNTLNFLSKMTDPKCNDREWFKLNEPVYRQAEKEWKDFLDNFTELLCEVDDHVPPLPAKDVVHRIYRDIRFSPDKTPYKRNFSGSWSRSGRKGIFAGFQPGGNSIIAAGSWCPAKNELATIRANILRDSSRLRQVISAPAFVKYFGKPDPSSKGRKNIFGRDDELKTAPKGIDKNHADIDLLKCRSFAVVHKFTDEEVLADDFKNKLAELVGVMRPLVHCLNDMMTIPPDDSDADGDGAEDDEDEA